MESIRSNLRRRHLADIEFNPLEGARSQLEAALETTSAYKPLLSELIDEREWKVRPAIRFRTHRPRFGKALIFLKRRVVLPVVYWLYEYCADNFRAQRKINSGLMILIETLAQENARLRREMERVLASLDPGSEPMPNSRRTPSESSE